MQIALSKEQDDTKKKIAATSILINSGILIDETTKSKLALEKLTEIENK